MEEGVDFFTSGSTGKAKPVRKSLASLRADAEELAGCFAPLFAGAAVASTVRAHHMYGKLWVDLLPARTGAEVLPGPILSFEELCAVCAGRPKVLFVTTPSFLEKVACHPDRGSLPRVFSGIVSSGSLLRREVSEEIRRCAGVCPLEIFGSTEAGSVAWRRQENGPAWRLFDAVSVSCLAGDGRLSVDSPFCLTRPFVMGDAGEMLGGRRFLLKGRTDRRVKILEETVSLPEVEEALCAHPFVARAHAVASGGPVPRVWALAVLTAPGRDALRRGTYSGLIRALRLALGGRLPPEALPRRIRFVRELPANSQGKLPREDVLPLLESRLQEPVIDGWAERGDAVTARLTFPPDSIVFRGHFPSFPILPGVAQLYWAHLFLRKRFGGDFAPAAVRRLKFRRLIRPGQGILMRLERVAAGRFDFLFSTEGGAVCTSGSYENGAR